MVSFQIPLRCSSLFRIVLLETSHEIVWSQYSESSVIFSLIVGLSLSSLLSTSTQNFSPETKLTDTSTKIRIKGSLFLVPDDSICLNSKQFFELIFESLEIKSLVVPFPSKSTLFSSLMSSQLVFD